MDKLADFSLINLAWNPTNVWKPREATFSLCHPPSSRSFLPWKLLIHLKMGQTRTNHKKQKLDPPFQVHGKKAYKVGGFGWSGIFQLLVIFAAEVEKAPVRVRKWRELLNKLQKNATLNASFLCGKAKSLQAEVFCFGYSNVCSGCLFSYFATGRERPEENIKHIWTGK